MTRQLRRIDTKEPDALATATDRVTVDHAARAKCLRVDRFRGCVIGHKAGRGADERADHGCASENGGRDSDAADRALALIVAQPYDVPRSPKALPHHIIP